MAAPEEHRKVGRILCDARQKVGLNQAELASRLSMSQSSVSKIESGERRASVPDVYAICTALGVPFATVMSRIERELARAGD